MKVPEVNKVGDKTRQSVKWSFSLKIVQKIFFFTSSVIVARILTPEDFGLATMALTLDTITWLVLSFGISAAIVHYQDNIEERLNAAFWFTTLSATIIVLILLMAAPAAAEFYHAPLLKEILQISAISLYISSFTSVHKAILTKKIEFKTISIIDTITYSTVSIMYIVLALMGFGVWSFIYPKIVFALLNSFMLWNSTRWIPSLNPHFEYWKEMICYGKDVVFANVLDYTLNNSAYIIIGTLVGSTSLGLFTFAYEKSMWVVSNITYPITMIVFPSFSRLQNHPEKLQSVYYKTIKMLALVSFPYALAQIIIGREFITLIFGNKWLPAVAMFQVILAYSMMRSIIQPGTPLLQGIGKPEIAMKWNLVFAPLYIGSIFLGFKLGGIHGITVAVATVGVTGGLIFMKIICRANSWAYKQTISNLYPALICSLIMCIGIFPIKQILDSFSVPDIITLFTVLNYGFILYIISLSVFFEKDFTEFIRDLKKFIPLNKFNLKRVKNAQEEA